MTTLDPILSRWSRRGIPATLLRVALGGVFLAHALAKPLSFTFPGTEAFFEANGFPGWTVYPVFLVELLGGAALVVGFHTRMAALALLPVTLGALKPHLAQGWMFTNTGGGWEYVAFLLVALGAQAMLGGGALSLDALLGKAGRSEPLGSRVLG